MDLQELSVPWVLEDNTNPTENLGSTSSLNYENQQDTQSQSSIFDIQEQSRAIGNFGTWRQHNSLIQPYRCYASPLYDDFESLQEPPDDNAFYMIQSSSSLLNDSADIQLSEDWLLLDPNKSVSVLINRFSSYSVNFTPIYSHIARVTTRTRQDLIARRMAQAKSNKRRSVLFSYVTLHQAPSFFCLNPS